MPIGIFIIFVFIAVLVGFIGLKKRVNKAEEKIQELEKDKENDWFFIYKVV